MSDKITNYPTIRFVAFNDTWKQSKLAELLTPADERNNVGRYGQDDILAASLGTELVKKCIFFGLRSTEESVKNYRVVKPGDVIYTKSPIKGYPNGIIRTNKGVDGIVPSLYCVYKNISSINSSIIQNYFEDKGRLNAYLHPLVNIGARNNVNITDLGFLEGNIFLPKEIEEQNKIVDIFNYLTNIIVLHQRKLDLLKVTKKSMLQKMFPRDGENVPEIRFGGFSDAWEQRKVIEVCDYVDYRGKTPTKTEDGIFLITAKNVKDGYIDYESSQEYISDEDYEEVMRRGVPKLGDVLITTEAPCGNVAQINREDIALAQRIIKYRGKENLIDNTFLKYYFLSPRFQNVLSSKASGGTVKGIKGSILHQQMVIYPYYEEQVKLGAYLEQLSNLITLHQRELDLLKDLKKSMLKQMFI